MPFWPSFLAGGHWGVSTDPTIIYIYNYMIIYIYALYMHQIMCIYIIYIYVLYFDSQAKFYNNYQTPSSKDDQT